MHLQRILEHAERLRHWSQTRFAEKPGIQDAGDFFAGETAKLIAEDFPEAALLWSWDGRLRYTLVGIPKTQRRWAKRLLEGNHVDTVTWETLDGLHKTSLAPRVITLIAGSRPAPGMEARRDEYLQEVYRALAGMKKKGKVARLRAIHEKLVSLTRDLPLPPAPPEPKKYLGPPRLDPNRPAKQG